MIKMRTVAVFAMVVVVASLCAAKPYRLPGLMEHPPELDVEHPDEDYYPESPDYPQVPERQPVDPQYPSHDDRYLRPIDSSDSSPDQLYQPYPELILTPDLDQGFVPRS